MDGTPVRDEPWGLHCLANKSKSQIYNVNKTDDHLHSPMSLELSTVLLVRFQA